jgi:hypothetical protein
MGLYSSEIDLCLAAQGSGMYRGKPQVRFIQADLAVCNHTIILILPAGQGSNP